MTNITKWLIESNRLFNVEVTTMYPNVTNQMPNPYDPAVWPNNDTRTDITNVESPNPSGTPITGLVEQVGAAADGIIESSPVAANIGDKFYICAVAKPEGDVINDLRFRFSDDIGFLQNAIMDLSTGELVTASNAVVKITDTVNGYKLFEAEWTVTRNTTGIEGQIFMWDSSAGGVPALNSKMNIQAAFAGLANNYPGLLQRVQVC